MYWNVPNSFENKPCFNFCYIILEIFFTMNGLTYYPWRNMLFTFMSFVPSFHCWKAMGI